MNEHLDYQSKAPSKATLFFWWCAGADNDILQKSSYSDHVKYGGIGGIVLATGILASIAMYFAIWYIFENIKIAIPIGILWGAIIFNLDRFIVSSTGKGDGTDSITKKELINASPRLLMAMILGITISAPLEVFIFEKEIKKQFLKNDNQELDSYKTKLQKRTESSIDYLKVTKDIAILNQKIDTIRSQESVLNSNILMQTNNGGCKSKCQALQKQLGEKMAEEAGFIRDINDQKNKIQAMLYRDSLELEKLSKNLKGPRGLLERILVLESIPGAEWPTWMIRLMFVFIEVAPVLLKLMLMKSPYDYMSENVNQILETKQGINREYIFDENNKMHAMKGFFNPKRIIAIVEHQSLKEEENAKEAISVFAEKEKEKIRKDPDSYLKPD